MRGRKYPARGRRTVSEISNCTYGFSTTEVTPQQLASDADACLHRSTCEKKRLDDQSGLALGARRAETRRSLSGLHNCNTSPAEASQLRSLGSDASNPIVSAVSSAFTAFNPDAGRSAPLGLEDITGTSRAQPPAGATDGSTLDWRVDITDPERQSLRALEIVPLVTVPLTGQHITAQLDAATAVLAQHPPLAVAAHPSAEVGRQGGMAVLLSSQCAWNVWRQDMQSQGCFQARTWSSG